MKVHIVNPSTDYIKMFEGEGWEVVSNPLEADLIQFTGGEDVSPELYGEKNTHSHNNLARDVAERIVYRAALDAGIPMAGICRGGQFLHVMNGGKMIQHQEGHCGGHEAYYLTKMVTVPVSSTHHQVMAEKDDPDYLKLMWTDDALESIYYEKTNCLCFQPHPEFAGIKRCRKAYFNFINIYLMKK